jgi:hypothetical protein
MSLLERLALRSAESPDALAVRVEGRASAPEVLTRARLLEAARAKAEELHSEGVRAGDRVLLIRPTEGQWIVDLFGTWAAGAVPVPLAPPQTLRPDRLVGYRAGIAAAAKRCGASHCLARTKAMEAIDPPLPGGPNTLPLLPLLEEDDVIAFPASRSSQMAKHERTPPLAPSYAVEAMRATASLLAGSAKAGFAPSWIGNTPAWSDAFRAAGGDGLPAAVLATYHHASGSPYWGEKVPGMDHFLAAYEKHGKDLSPPDFYILASYCQGLIQLDAVRKAINSGDATRAGFRKAMRSIHHFTADGLIQPVNLTKIPYVTGTWTRTLKPDTSAGATGWSVMADWAEPKALAAAPAAK